MLNDFLVLIYFLMWYCLVVLACLFTISGLDDLFIDVYFWIRYSYRLWKMRRYQPLTYEQLITPPEQAIAVLVPCWHEANVIGTMLKHNTSAIDYSHYIFFVGVYPNDPATVAEVQALAQLNPHVQCVVGDTPGPTNKAANLNAIYQYIKTFEKTRHEPFKIFVFHDSEDVVHPLSFKLYNYLVPRKDMIQIPVFPLEVNFWNFTHWLYADEFAESHTKDIVVREALKAHVPSAGVGTAFSRRALQTLEDATTGLPFSTDSLTEDYHTSLALRMRHLQPIFVTQSVTRMHWQRKGLFNRKYIQIPTKEYIATRALFPTEYVKAVRQKARWIIGIVFQEWDHSSWTKDWRIRYTLMHDRKSFITHFINGFSYLIFSFWLIYSLVTKNNPDYPSLQEQFNAHRWVWWLIVAVSIIMVERLVQRMIAIHRIYGWRPLLLAIPRVFYGNILNLHALLRAYRLYFAATKPKINQPASQPKWDKTDHEFPGRHVLVPYRRKLGDMLLEQQLITREQLRLALIEQQKTGERLGIILQRMQWITPQQLTTTLANQYQLPLFCIDQLIMAQQQCWPMLSKKTQKWLRRHAVSAVAIDKTTQNITCAITDPTNELLIHKIVNYFAPSQVDFVLLQ